MSDEKPPLPQDKSASATGGSKPSLADLIAQTPGAQTREQLLERIKARQQKRSKKRQKPAPSEEELTKPEPMNIISDPYGSAADVIQRIQANAKAKQKEEPKAQQSHPKASSCTSCAKKDKPVPPDKK